MKDSFNIFRTENISYCFFIPKIAKHEFASGNQFLFSCGKVVENNNLESFMNEFFDGVRSNIARASCH